MTPCDRSATGQDAERPLNILNDQAGTDMIEVRAIVSDLLLSEQITPELEFAVKGTDSCACLAEGEFEGCHGVQWVELRSV